MGKLEKRMHLWIFQTSTEKRLRKLLLNLSAQKAFSAMSPILRIFASHVHIMGPMSFGVNVKTEKIVQCLMSSVVICDSASAGFENTWPLIFADKWNE